MKHFLPVTAEEMRDRGWQQPDFVYVIGDAYVDHSSFGPAIISRVLESHGYRVALIPQPDWKDEESIAVFGMPRLGFLVSAGNMDSMVNHYSVTKHRRSTDAYTPGGKTGRRPDRATIVYCNLIRKKYKKVPIIIGGIEASLRRLAHYDYWSDRLKRSILLDSGADLLIYGMGELAIIEAADALDSGLAIEDVTFIKGTVYKAKDVSGIISGQEGIELPDFDSLENDRLEYARSFNIQYRNTDFASGRPLIEKYGEKRYIVQNPPMRPLTTAELDEVYELPYMNAWHPSYDAEGSIPAFAEVKFSLTSCRGCFGGCSFCALTFHQGRIVQARSQESLLREAEAMTRDPDFKGYIHDVGGPTANFRAPACKKQTGKGVCPDRQCLYPKPCANLKADHRDYIELLRRLRALPGVKKVFIRSGIRFDYMLADRDDSFLHELCKYHVSGQLRVAPEHVTDHVLDLMGKPRAEVYREFCRRFERVNKKLGLKQYVVPYLISSHPGSEMKDAIALAESVRDMGYMPEQVQDFYPTPSTISTCMYYTGVDPRTMKKVSVTVSPHEKSMQRALIQYRDPANYRLVKEALLREGREDLIGFDRKHCLIPPRPIKAEASKNNGGAKKKNMSEASGDGGEKTGMDRKNDRSEKVGTDRRGSRNEKNGEGRGSSGTEKVGKSRGKERPEKTGGGVKNSRAWKAGQSADTAKTEAPKDRTGIGNGRLSRGR